MLSLLPRRPTDGWRAAANLNSGVTSSSRADASFVQMTERAASLNPCPVAIASGDGVCTRATVSNVVLLSMIQRVYWSRGCPRPLRFVIGHHAA